jgi:hypothetical protein
MARRGGCVKEDEGTVRFPSKRIPVVRCGFDCKLTDKERETHPTVTFCLSGIIFGMRIRCTAAFMSIALVVFFLTALNVAAQQFPRLQEENLAGQQVVLPDAAAGKVAILVFGFTKASQNTTGAWMKRLQPDYGKSTDVVLYQLPVLEEAPRILHGLIVSGMKKGVAENLRTNFIPVMHNEAELKKLVGYRETDDAYVVVLDRDGKVAYQAHGGTDAAGYADLQIKVQGLVK